jgi:hypothetical protein
MAEGGTRPTAAKLYQSPADSGTTAGSNYTPPGVPAPRNMEQLSGRPHQAPETDSQRIDPTPAVGTAVTHRVSGAHGTVVGHDHHGYGTALPKVQWAGEDASWPQGVSANALRIEGSEPMDLYKGNQDATSSRPLNRNTGAL